MSITWKKDEIKERSSKLLDTIISLTKADDVITEEEQEMINVIREEVYRLESKFATMVDKQQSIEDATTEIRSIFEEVITSAANKAKEDGTITSDELVLIDKLAKFFRNEDIVQYLS